MASPFSNRARVAAEAKMNNDTTQYTPAKASELHNVQWRIAAAYGEANEGVSAGEPAPRRER